MRRRAAAGGGGAPKSLRPSANLLAAAMAGAVNQAFTLPLENITTRMQTAPQQHPPRPPITGATTRLSTEASSNRTEARGEGAGARMGPSGTCSGEISGGGCGREAVKTSVLANSRGDDSGRGIDQCIDPAPAGATKTLLGEEGGKGINSRGNDLSPGQRRQRPRQSFAAVAGELYREGGGIGRFWRGFAPSLILTCNPAINYTAFDLLKALWLRRRDAAAASVIGPGGPGSGGMGAAGASGTARRGTGGFLNPLEAFLVAAAAKSLATVITYPLIRAKVVLMTSHSPSSSPTVGVDSDPASTMPFQGGDDRASWAGRTNDTKTHHAGHGVGGSGASVDVRTLVNGEVAAVVPVTGRGAPAPMDARVMATAPAEAAVEEGRGGEVEGSHTRSMGTVLVEIFRREGLGGLYAGCGAQV